MIKRILPLLVLFLSWQTAMAHELFFDDFQDGDTEGWGGNPRKGDIRLTSYKGNISMRLTHDAYAVRLVETKGLDELHISAQFAATNLRAKDHCLLEAGFGDDVWVEMGRIGDGQDDGLSLHKVGGVIANDAGHNFVAVRLRIEARKDKSTCWADNIRVTGTIAPDSLVDSLPFEMFFSDTALAGPVQTSAFAPPPMPTPPTQNLSAEIKVDVDGGLNGFSLFKDDFNYAGATGQLDSLPPLTLRLVSDGTALIPQWRGPRKSDHTEWEWIIEPGMVWHEADDAGWNRASLPIALQERNANCVHNGVMSFLYKQDQISQAIIQFGSETCAYVQFDLWSKLPMSVTADHIAQEAQIIDGYRREIKNRLPHRPLSELQGGLLADIGSTEEVSPENMTVYGYVADNILYASDCPTRFGPDPFCETLPLPSYSMAKSMVAAIGLMRLEQLYPGAREAKIADYVPACRAARWGDVSFENMLDMASGNYTSDIYDEDESAAKTWAFMTEESHAAKIDKACNTHKRRAPPGTKFVYHTTDTYILGTAMQAFLREKSGNPQADLYNDVVRPIWRALHLGPLSETTRRTNDAAAQPFTGWGLTLHADDIARIGLFLQAGGMIEGQPWLDQDLLKAALQQKPDDRGLKAIDDSLKYRAGFWAYNAGPFLGCADDMWIPSMSGFGGLATVLMPNGHLYFYISDGHEYAWRRAARASNQLKPFCKAR